jgi:uncharacterized membrane protein YcfT
MATESGTKMARTAGSSWLDPTKGLAIFMVVAYHVYLYLTSENVDAVLGRAKAVLELFPMPAFFLIAGMFASRHAKQSFPDLWRRRLVPLLYMYLLWSVLRAAFYYLSPGLNGELGEIPARDPLSLAVVLVWPTSSYWFLYALLVFTASRWAIARFPGWLQVTATAIVSTLFTTGLVDAHNIGWNRIGALFFFFVVGAVWPRQIRDAVARARDVHLALAVVLLLGVTGLVVLGFRWVPFLALAGQVLSVAVGILLASRLGRGRVSRSLAALGSSSLKIYLFHLYIIATATALIAALDPAWPRWVDVGIQAALTALALAGSFLLIRLTRRARWLFGPPAIVRRALGGTAPAKPERAAGAAPLPVTGRHRPVRVRLPGLLAAASRRSR